MEAQPRYDANKYKTRGEAPAPGHVDTALKALARDRAETARLYAQRGYVYMPLEDL